jgi:hypothetical protein
MQTMQMKIDLELPGYTDGFFGFKTGRIKNLIRLSSPFFDMFRKIESGIRK